jgi:hypothetical protein
LSATHEPLAQKLVRKAHSALHKHIFVHFPRHFERASEPVTLVMPVAVKDLHQAEHAIASVRAHLMHPVAQIILVGQSSPDIAALAARVGATYIDEEHVLPAPVRAFRYVTRHRNRNGWIRQQILKLMADEFASTNRLLILDSDTLLVRDLSFVHKGKPVLFTSDEYNPTYHACSRRLLGPLRDYPRSFIAHCMLYERPALQALKAAITARHACHWTDAILHSIDISVEESFSEYELYGTFIYNHLPESFQTRYWYNRKHRGQGPLHGAAGAMLKQNFISNHMHLHRMPADVGSGANE